MDLSAYDGLRLRVKGDGQIFKFNIKTVSMGGGGSGAGGGGGERGAWGGREWGQGGEGRGVDALAMQLMPLNWKGIACGVSKMNCNSS
jgi:hypothetical protein